MLPISQVSVAQAFPVSPAPSPSVTMPSQAQGAEPHGSERCFGAGFAERLQQSRAPERVEAPEDPVLRMFDRSGLRDGYERYLETTDRAAQCDRIGDTAGAGRARAEGQMQLLAMQMGVQDHHMKIELASKVVEHGSTSTKTVLQTQM